MLWYKKAQSAPKCKNCGVSSETVKLRNGDYYCEECGTMSGKREASLRTADKKLTPGEELLLGTRERLANEVNELRAEAASGPLKTVIPRFAPELRRKALLLPLADRIARMSMYELEKVSDKVSAIRRDMEKYDIKRVSEVANG